MRVAIEVGEEVSQPRVFVRTKSVEKKNIGGGGGTSSIGSRNASAVASFPVIQLRPNARQNIACHIGPKFFATEATSHEVASARWRLRAAGWPSSTRA